MFEVNDDANGARHAIVQTEHTQEAALDTADNRFWRVVDTGQRNADGHLVSYDIHVNGTGKYRRDDVAHAFTNHDVYLTEFADCEHLASENLHPPCGKTLDTYLTGQRLTRPIVWVQVSFHHVPRDEDEPIMNQRSQGFVLVPRDVTAQNELVR
ncbi:hypothetical protein [Dactylosporangium sp. NPDC051484]|uniref:copper amine oxidase n=1 Tax=Dactylosporangium sp. NPDC051484 TaxID=3154942 RepID=UPI00344DC74C